MTWIIIYKGCFFFVSHFTLKIIVYFIIPTQTKVSWQVKDLNFSMCNIVHCSFTLVHLQNRYIYMYIYSSNVYRVRDIDARPMFLFTA